LERTAPTHGGNPATRDNREGEAVLFCVIPHQRNPIELRILRASLGLLQAFDLF